MPDAESQLVGSEAMMMKSHEDYMRLAIEAATNVPVAPFGAVIVEHVSGEVLATGWNQSRKNPIWHGEIDVIHRLAETKRDAFSQPLTLYTTAEPCPMCQSAILWAGIDQVVFGTSIVTLMKFGWNQIDISSEEIVHRTPFRECTIIGGILEAECDQLFRDAKT